MVQALEGQLCALVSLNAANTFSLIAIMLGRLGTEVDECIEKYTNLSKDVFGKKAHHVPLSWSGDMKPRFNSEALKTAITKVVTDCGLPADARLNDGQYRDCHT